MLDDFPKEIELRDGSNAVLRIATRADQPRLILFFLTIAEDERNFLRYDVTESENLEGWFGGPNWEDVFPLIAEINGKIVGVSVLKGYRARWVSHIGEFWMMVNEDVRGLGIGRYLASEMFNLAGELGMEKLLVEVRDDYTTALKIFRQMGFNQEGVLAGVIKNDDGTTQDMLVMGCNIRDFYRSVAAVAEQYAF